MWKGERGPVTNGWEQQTRSNTTTGHWIIMGRKTTTRVDKEEISMMVHKGEEKTDVLGEGGGWNMGNTANMVLRGGTHSRKSGMKKSL